MCTAPCSVDTAKSGFLPALAELEYAHAYGGLMYAPSWTEWHLKTSDLLEETYDCSIERVGTSEWFG